MGLAALPKPQGAVGPAASPCNRVCTIHEASGWCRGCLRTLAEIATWATLDDAGKRAVWQALPARRAAWVAARGARQCDPAQPAPP